MEHTTELGYKAIDTLSGMDIYDDSDIYICNLRGVHVSDFMDENENIDNDRLDAVIETEMEAVDFLNDQADYMWKKKDTTKFGFLEKKLYLCKKV